MTKELWEEDISSIDDLVNFCKKECDDTTSSTIPDYYEILCLC